MLFSCIPINRTVFHAISSTTKRNGLIYSRRFISNTKQLMNNAAKTEENRTQQLDPRHLGIAQEVYIPTQWSNMPSIFLHPIVYAKSIVRRIYTLGMNTIQVALFRYQSGLKPNFVLWKNSAIETYINVNKAFAKKDIMSIKPSVSIWVEETLKERAKQLPKNAVLDWELKKFNEVPKLITVQALMIPGRPLEYLQIVYKFNTKQRLIKFNKESGKTDTLDRDVIDYTGFLIDANTNDVILLGTVFESKPDAKLPQNNDNVNIAIKNMKINGDIYRLPQPIGTMDSKKK
ncbi:related to Protein MBA1, mitochondrial [Saccharomycodes ludwigii]|uniref:Related to Protein MBA1, mitochondrial n=1 Tax=Saccharomycodes ludwigii TaxID=36035 RepID=A0A376BC89_9ASCO|nr:hypothetical protein SCDLUD_002032 [Saccharomycodes ludwigii]KAH3902216.1 hypothetical protein SCDLUD_002032 [Saccharomycodes ludwigii]SSD62219.1 related to Protein MBA1, mitochondrial [Saccharomycodes ludwigii]